MGIFDREGPSMYSHLSCSGCQWHSNVMRISGRNPIYDHYCIHAEADHAPDGWVIPSEGRHIGTDSYTPEWCPVRRKNSGVNESPTTANNSGSPKCYCCGSENVIIECGECKERRVFGTWSEQ